jgi:hypothetical protein
LGRRPSGRSSTNGSRSQASTFSCTISFDSANVAAASAGSSSRGIASRRRAAIAVVPSSVP